MSVVIETTLGDLTVDLYIKERPRSCLNFLKLCKVKYYNLNLFHYVQRGFIAQTGDPTGTGRGGDSVFRALYGEQARYFEAEKVPRIKHNKIGTLSMVNCGDSNLGSQFFITLSPDLDYLNDEHCVFGEVVEGGEEVLTKLNEAICDDDHRPYQDIRITHTVILEDPFDDPPGLQDEIPPASPEPTREMLDSGRIGADEKINDMDGKTLQEMDEIIQEKEAKARATILEMVGDLPEADMAPPENVLFVCKLNPVTTDEDLEIIFSRFGKIVSCDVIRDFKSGESLQYAFIEFSERKSCEDAYFKMDNVLIDDRRIHVDFSQSVAKFKWRGKGKGVQIFEDKKEEAPKFTAPWIRQPPGGRSSVTSQEQYRKSDSDNRSRRRDSPDNYRKSEKRRESPPSYRKSDKRRDSPPSYRKSGKRRNSQSPPSYRKSDKRRDSPEAYRKSDKCRDSPEAYRKSDKCRDSPEAYRKSDKCRDSPEAYRKFDKRRNSPEAYRKSDKRRESPEAHRKSGKRDSPEPYRKSDKGRDSPENYPKSYKRRNSPEPYRKSDSRSHKRRDSPESYRKSESESRSDKRRRD